MAPPVEYASAAAFGDRIARLSDTQALERAFGEAVAALGFDGFVHARIPRGTLGRLTPSQFGERVVVTTTFPEAWRARYREMGYFARDPVLAVCQRQVLPVTWDAVERLPDAPGDLGVIRDARCFGLTSGFSVPIHTPEGDVAVLSLGSSATPARLERRLAECRHDIHLMALLYHDRRAQLLADGDGAGPDGPAAATAARSR